MITLVLLSYRNPKHLERALSFYKKHLPEVSIIIADSHPEEGKIENREVVRNSRDSFTSLLHLEYDQKISFPAKVGNAAENIHTPYSILVGDDDFFSPYAIRRSIKFLESNLEYQFAYGQQYGFLFDGETITWYPSGYYENPRSFSDDCPLRRLNSYLRCYTTTFYSVFRTSILKGVVKQTCLYAPSLVFFDNMFTMQALLRGKGFFFEEPFWFKEMSDLSTSSTYNDTWFLGKGFEENGKLMQEGIRQTLINLLLMPPSEAFLKSRDSIHVFMETTFCSMYPSFFARYEMGYLKRAMKAVIPSQIQKKLIKLRNFLLAKKINVGQNYLHNSRSPYFLDFKEIEKTIKKSQVKAERQGFEGAVRL